MLSLPKHLAEAFAKHKHPVFTRFLGFARNDTTFFTVMLSKRSAVETSRGSVAKIAALLNNMFSAFPRGETFLQSYITTPWIPQEAGTFSQTYT